MLVAQNEPRLLSLLRVGSVRFAALYFAPFYAAIEATCRGGPRWIAIGAALCVLLCLGIELLNRVTDRREDAVNNPIRTEMCLRFGYQDIAIISIGIFVTLIPLGFGWLLMCANVELFCVQTLVWFVAWNYSFGLRLKSRRCVSLFVLGGTFLLPFLSGWTMYGSMRDLPPLSLYPPIFAASIAGVKDITDVPGDARRGYHSLFVDLAARSSRLRLPLLLSAPHLFLVVLLALKRTPPWSACLLLLWPLSLMVGRLVRGAVTPLERRSVREITYHLWMLMIVATLWVIHPSERLAIVLAITIAFWMFATRRLHWQVGLEGAQLRALRDIVSR